MRRIKDALAIVLDFQADYMDNVQNYTVRELAEKFDMELCTPHDNIDLAEIVNRCMFADLFSYPPFLECPVIGHYMIEGEEYFALAEVGIAQCDGCCRTFPVYMAVSISEHGYGLVEFIAHEENRIADSDMKTMYDVADYLAEHSCALEAASLF